MLEVRPLPLEGVFELKPKRYGDDRGFFSQVWSVEETAATGLDLAFVQDNHSYSAEKGVLRGLHYQLPPFAQDKLVRVTRGSIYDVAVDIRRGSPTFGQWTGLVVSAELWNQILVPTGFAHGFVTLEPHTEVQYKVTAPYRPSHERSVRFDDPSIGIDWPIDADEAILSPKDKEAPLLSQVDEVFA